GRLLRWGAGALFWISLLSIAGVYAWALLTPHVTVARTTSEILAGLDFIFTFLVLFESAILATVLCFGVWLIASGFRLKPARLVILREQGKGSGVVRKMLRTELRPYGHMIGLSEKAGSVSSAASYIALANGLRNRSWLNLRAAFARKETQGVRASDAWRPL